MAGQLTEAEATHLLGYVACVIGYKNRNSRLLATPFLALPDARESPRYWANVKHPRSLIGIQEALLNGQYTTPKQVYADCKLVFRNALLSNTRSSLNYADATRMEVAVDEVWETFTALPPISSFATVYGDDGGPMKRMRYDGYAVPGPIGPHSSNDELAAWTATIHAHQTAAAPVEMQPVSYQEYEPDNSLASLLGSPGVDLPGTPGASDFGGPYSAAATPPPAGFPNKRGRGRPPKYRPPPTPSGYDDSFDFDPADDDGEDGSRGGREFRTVDEQSGWLVKGPHEDPTTLYQTILFDAHSHNRQLAAPLLTLPTRQDNPYYYSQVRDPISIDIIESRINAGYASAEAFDRDMAKLFNNGRLAFPPDTQAYVDLLVLRRLWLELTRVGRLDAPTPPAQPGLVISSVSFGPGALPVDESNAAIKFSARDRVPLDSIQVKGETLRVGDFVHLINILDPSRPIVGQIFRCFKRTGTSQRYVNVNWFYRPEETFHQVNRLFFPNEVFKTGFSFDHAVEDFLEHCFVMFHTRYMKGRPKPPHWHQNMPTYVVEHRYYDATHTFKKIKNWTSCLPEEIRNQDPGQDLNTDIALPAPVKVNSPFARGVAGTGGIGGGELDDEQSRFMGVRRSICVALTHQPATGVPISRPAPVATQRPPPQPYMAPQLPVVHAPAPIQQPPVVAQQPMVSNSLVVGASSQAQAALRAEATPVPTQKGTTGNTQGARPHGTTALENAASGDQFAPLPSSLYPRTGEMMWFGAPPTIPPARPAPQHSLAYLDWLARKQTASN